MRKVLDHVQKRVLAGIIFLIPLFAVLLLLKKLWTTLTDAGNYLVQLVGLKSLLGNNSVPVATAFLLILLFYFFGWLVKFSSLNRVKDWLESTLLQYIPGYLTYKAQIQEKVNPKDDGRMPVWVTMPVGKRPGFLIDRKRDESIVFFPNSPDSNNGQVMMVESSRITRLPMNATTFLKSLQTFGKDLVLEEV